jgi:methylphosphotriester-DNA--protein-cysteine methyltransferase
LLTRRIKRTPEVCDAIEAITKNESKFFLRHLPQQVNLSVETCRVILKRDLHLYPSRMTSVPELLAADPAQTFQFCKCFLNTLHNDDATLNKTFFTDEA